MGRQPPRRGGTLSTYWWIFVLTTAIAVIVGQVASEYLLGEVNTYFEVSATGLALVATAVDIAVYATVFWKIVL